ncbi:MAG: hemerythrin domain-containing protein [Deltaproteobacteria bacterium]|nr:hemerythrin domain-containing protein [Deltaproteobacteria bacterium]
MLHHLDRLQKQPERGIEGNALSPMDPPSAYAPPAADHVPTEALHPFLQQLCREHAACLDELQRFETAIATIQQTGFTKTEDLAIRHFFHYFEHDLVPHTRREERQFFPMLHQRLQANGERAPGTDPTTAVDLMEDDHIKSIQLAAVVLNFLGLAFRLPDERSRLLVLDAALEQAKHLVELLRLHIFREEQILFPTAHRLITTTEFNQWHSEDDNAVRS